MSTHPTPFELAGAVDCKPLDQWQNVGVELLGTETVFVQGERWRHRVIQYGQGAPLILLHGAGGHAETYARNIKNLGQHFRVYCPDSLYHGYSSNGPYRDRFGRHDEQVDAIVDLMDALGIERAHIEGESMGATNACEFALRYPERAGKVILNTGLPRVRLTKTDFTPAAKQYSELIDISKKSITDPTFELVQKRLQWLMADPARMTDDMVNTRLRMYQDPDINAAMRRWFKVDLPAEEGADPWDYDPQWEESDLKAITAECLVFWTEKNPGEGPEVGQYLAGLIPGAQYYEMTDAAHWPQWEKPEEHDQVLIEFIKGAKAA